jgi:acetyl-CoA carboxylase biotin carboxyl carrier protein
MVFHEIKEFISIFDVSDIGKIHIKNGEFEIVLEKTNADKVPAQPVAPVVPQTAAVHNEESPPSTAQQQAKEVQEKKEITTLNSPMVATFYVAPSPGAEPFVKVGDVVSKGQIIAILEAMKIMNEWEAEFDCKILKVLVEDGQPVEYGTPIFEVEKI